MDTIKPKELSKAWNASSVFFKTVIHVATVFLIVLAGQFDSGDWTIFMIIFSVFCYLTALETHKYGEARSWWSKVGYVLAFIFSALFSIGFSIGFLQGLSLL